MKKISLIAALLSTGLIQANEIEVRAHAQEVVAHLNEMAANANNTIAIVGDEEDPSCTYSTVQKGIDSGAYEVRVVDQGVAYIENLEILDKNLVIKGNYSSCSDAINNITDNVKAHIDGDHYDKTISIETSANPIEDFRVSLNHLKVTNGRSENSSGAGIYVNNTKFVSIIDSEISGNNSNVGGGGIAIRESSVLIKDSNIFSNQANTSAGVECVNSNLMIDGNTEVSDNIASLNVGGVGCYSSINSKLTIFSPVMISANKANQHGGGISIENVTTNIYGSQICESELCFGTDSQPVRILNNIANYDFSGSGNGGGVYLYSLINEANIDFENVVIKNNDSRNGGAIYAGNGARVIIDSHAPKSCWSPGKCNQITDNEAFLGGGFYLADSANVKIGSTYISRNKAEEGVVAAVYGDDLLDDTNLQIESSLITDNGNFGSGLYSDINLFKLITNANLILEHVTIANNNVFGELLLSAGDLVSTVIEASILTDINPIYFDFGGQGSSVITQCLIVSDDSTLPFSTSTVVADPLFLNPLSGDYHLSSDSIAIDFCQQLVIAVDDMDGVLRGIDDVNTVNRFGVFDLGAYEYSLPVAIDDYFSVKENSIPESEDVLFNDEGGLKEILSVTQPANGMVVITNNGADLTYQPNPDYCNDGNPTDDFTYTITGGSFATVFMTVSCVDETEPPVAIDDMVEVDKDSEATVIDVLVNDTDPDGGLKKILDVTQPVNGTVILANYGVNLSYQPNTDYCNDGAPTDDFTYTLNGGSQATVRVSVMCNGDILPPVAVDDAFEVNKHSLATAFDILGNDTDPDGGLLEVQSVIQPVNGTVMIINGGQGISYEPSIDYCNDGAPTDDFTYTLNGGSQATVRVSVMCNGDILPPVAVDDAFEVNKNSVSTAFDVLINDTDPDGGLLEVRSIIQPVNGTAMIINGGQGISYEPSTDYCNDGAPTDDFTYTLNGGSLATVRVSVMCLGDVLPPVAIADFYTILEDSGNNTLLVMDNDTDQDGGVNMIESITQSENGIVSIVNNGQGVNYKPNDDYCNSGAPTDNFSYTLNGGSSASVEVLVECVNDQPSMYVEKEIYIPVDQLDNLPVTFVACQFDYGPEDEDIVQLNQDMIVSVQSDENNILNSVDVLNNGRLLHEFSGNQGSATITVSLKDNGGIDNNGIDTSIPYTVKINVKDYLFKNGFEVPVCQ